MISRTSYLISFGWWPIVIIDINKPLGLTVENDLVDEMHLTLISRTQTKQPSRPKYNSNDIAKECIRTRYRIPTKLTNQQISHTHKQRSLVPFVSTLKIKWKKNNIFLPRECVRSQTKHKILWTCVIIFIDCAPRHASNAMYNIPYYYHIENVCNRDIHFIAFCSLPTAHCTLIQLSHERWCSKAFRFQLNPNNFIIVRMKTLSIVNVVSLMGSLNMPKIKWLWVK